jgi:hypothetical protein
LPDSNKDTASMPLHLLTPVDKAAEADAFDDVPPEKTWRGRAADGCYILVKGSLFLASSYLIALGLPLLFFLLVSGGSAEAFFAHLGNFADRFLAAEPERRIGFLSEVKLTLIGLATLVVIWRMPRFVFEIEAALSEERP